MLIELKAESHVISISPSARLSLYSVHMANEGFTNKQNIDIAILADNTSRIDTVLHDRTNDMYLYVVQ